MTDSRSYQSGPKDGGCDSEEIRGCSDWELPVNRPLELVKGRLSVARWAVCSGLGRRGQQKDRAGRLGERAETGGTGGQRTLASSE